MDDMLAEWKGKKMKKKEKKDLASENVWARFCAVLNIYFKDAYVFWHIVSFYSLSLSTNKVFLTD